MPQNRFRLSAVSKSVVGLFTLLALCAPAMALRPVVLDGGDVFSPVAISKADEVIAQIKERFAKDVMIETYLAIPADQAADFKRKGKDAFYADWITSRGKALRANGIMIIVTKDPGRLEIGVGTGTQQKAFTVKDREELKALMTKAFQQRKFDDGLLEGVDFVMKRLEQNAGGPVAAGQGGPAARPSAAQPEVGTASAPAAPTVPPQTGDTKATPAAPVTAPTTSPADEHHGADF